MALTRKKPREKHPWGQVFTPRPVADLMLSLSQSAPESPVLEPCAGQGVFLDALRDRGFNSVSALELDPELVTASDHGVREGSFVSWPFSEAFSLIVGNPPYVRWRDLDPELKSELEESPLWQSHFTSLSDYLTIFIARAVELLRPDGELIFITPSFWMHTQHSGQLREFMLARGHFTHLLHFGEATVFPGIGTSIVIFRYVRSAGGAPPIQLARYQGPRKVDFSQVHDFSDLIEDGRFSLGEIPPFTAGQPWVLADRETQANLTAMESACIPRSGAARLRPQAARQGELFEAEEPPGPCRLGQIADIANGMVSGLDAAFRIPDEVELNEQEASAVLMVAKGANLTSYRVTRLTRYIFVEPDLAEAEFLARYPTFAGLLQPYRDRLEARYSYGRDLPYWEWAFLRSHDFFRSARHLILTPCKERLSNKSQLRFALAPEGVIPTQDVTGIQLHEEVRESPEFILAQFNHPRMYDWVRFKGLMKGAVAEFSERPLSQMPVRRINWSDPEEVNLHDRLTELVRTRINTEEAEPEGTEISRLMDGLLELDSAPISL